MEDDSITFNRMRALLRGLPPRGAYTREVRYQGTEWGPAEEILAQVAELIDQSNRLFFSRHRDPQRDHQVWEPLQIDRPWFTKSKREPLRGEELVAAFRGLVDHEEKSIVEYVPAEASPLEGGDLN